MSAAADTTSGRMRDRRVLVTGGAGGIGSSIVARFVREGAEVAVLDLASAAERAPVGSRFFAVDLLDPEHTRGAVASAIADLGGVDVLVNSAGVFRLLPLLEISPDEWDRVLGINARATLITMQAVAPEMIAAGAGAIINLASMAAKSGGGMEGHYAASKAAVVALTRAAAIEWGRHGITVNAICPGYVLTEMGAGTRTPEQIESWTARSPLGRLGTPDDVSELAVYLATAGTYVTGQALNVTGGMIMH